MDPIKTISQNQKNIIILRSLRKGDKVTYNLRRIGNAKMIIKFGDVFKKVMDTENMMVVRRGDKHFCVSYFHLTCDVIEVIKKIEA